jgi:hypothetical protein
MDTPEKRVSVKVIGANGQISLGKQFAGRQILVEEHEPGVWLVRTATVLPDNERWLHASQGRSDLERALRVAERTPATRSDPDAIAKLGHGAQPKKRRKGSPRPKQ